ncbi:hypothetical protein [Brachymonas denitrificans]|jgi:hexokinase|uniref:Uncharacterized protein n=1 Tax=Brachymonas denitrificans DSM 15123 TaxID=1121117 RepID=A0A1H8DPQ6_9BURK|nr:hypothetical protein [Brachymonas denitrificans]SEN09229.1 hypothetical protein SAMN02745977_00404 [Brachymonas denitrificans DSM 15123]
MGLLDTLTQIVNAASQNSQPQQQQVEELQQAPADVLSQGLREAFDSKDTPSIGNLVGQMFGQSSNQQQAGLINQIIQALGPAAATALAGGVLQKVLKPGSDQVEAADVAQLSADEVTSVVNEAQAQRPELSQQLSEFYSQHSGLIKALGGVALLAAAIKMKQYAERN